MSKKSTESRTVTVAISDKVSVDVPSDRLAVGKAHGLTDEQVAKAFASIQGAKATAALQLADPAWWKLQAELQVKKAEAARAARRADREGRLAFEKEEALAKARAALGMSESERTLILSGRKALQPVKAKAENTAPPAPGNGSNGKSKAPLADHSKQAAAGVVQ